VGKTGLAVPAPLNWANNENAWFGETIKHLYSDADPDRTPADLVLPIPLNVLRDISIRLIL
jgi:hypothetical protein